LSEPTATRPAALSRDDRNPGEKPGFDVPWGGSIRSSLAGAGRRSRVGFSLIELMVTLIILSVIIVFAIQEYEQHIVAAKAARARNDLEDLAKAVRLYNIREEKPFEIGTFTAQYLGTFVGTYLETAPPLDPWGKPYLHAPELGVIYSCGPNLVDETTNFAGKSDDLVYHYLPADFYVTRAEYVDANRNGQIDMGDEVEISFSRPARMEGVSLFDFRTVNPENAFGSAKVVAPAKGRSLKIFFGPPLPPRIKIGETKIQVFYDIQSVVDFSSPPMPLKSLEDVVIQRKRM
jgi:general secretion pathway protein G